MSKEAAEQFLDLLGQRFKAHPMHGIEVGDEAPQVLNSFIEIIPTDAIKYEIDKKSGYTMVDRPHKLSNNMPCLYGFVPKTYCDTEVAAFANQKTGRTDIVGDGDPLDICVITERAITKGDLVVPCIPIGGFRMIDGGEADDKIIAVLKGDSVFESFKDISELPKAYVDRLFHYFVTYKEIPSDNPPKVEITHVYGKEEAYEVIKRSQNDYNAKFGNVDEKLKEVLGKLLS